MKKDSILLIDENTAIHTMAGLALSDIDLQLKTASSIKQAARELKAENTRLIICETDIDSSSFLFLSKLQTESKTKHIQILALIPEKHAEETTQEASRHGITHFLNKPFKSGQLRESVEEILSKNSQEASQSVVLVNIEQTEALVIEKMLVQRNLTCAILSDAALTHCRTSFTAALVDLANTTELRWHNQAQFGPLVAFTHKKAKKNLLKEAAHVISRPLSVAALEEVFDEFLPKRLPAPVTPKEELTELEPKEQALLAARISAAVYERLLAEQVLREANWEAASSIAKQEVLQICKELEKMLTGNTTAV